MRIKNKLILVLGASFILILSIMAVGLSIIIKKNLQQKINNELQSTMNAVSAIVNSSVESAIRHYLKALSEKGRALCNIYENKVQTGEMTHEAAFNEIRLIFLDEEFGNIGRNGYLLAVDSSGVIIIHPSAEDVDASEEEFMQQALLQKEGYIEYLWQNDGDIVPKQKAGYLTYFEPWDLLIWASSYIEDFSMMIKPEDIRKHLLSITIGETGYPYVLDSEGTLIVHPLLEGTNLFNSTDADGKYFIKEMLNDPNGEGFMYYRWQNPGEDEPRDKFQLYKRLDNYGWTVAISSYTDEYFWVLDIANLILITGIVVSIVVIIMSIFFISYQIRNANVALIESEEKHKRLVENLGKEYFFYMQTEDGEILYVSPSVTKMLGYTVEDYKENYLKYLTDNPINKIIHQKIKESLTGKKQPPYQVEIVDIDGNIRTLEVTKSPVLNEKGSIIAVDGIVHDITNKIKTARELDNLKDYLSNIIDSMPSVIVGIDSNGIITQWNKLANVTTGICSKDAKGKYLTDIMPMMSSQTQNIKMALKHKTIERDLIKKIVTATEIRFEDITIYPLESEDNEGSVIIIDDVTDKVKIEEMMIQSEKMMSIGGLAAGMAHEINNPLAGMMQTAEVIRSRLMDDIPANKKAAEKIGIEWDIIKSYISERKIDSMVERIHSSGSRAADIVSNMLNFSRKNDNTETVLADIKEIIKNSINLAKNYYDIKERYDFRKIRIIKTYDSKKTLIPCKPAQIEQVILNILCNAADAFQDLSKVEKKKEPSIEIIIQHDIKLNQIVLRICDNGPGMDQDTKNRIFEPFFTTKPTDRGTGLGLSVSYFIIVNDHDGELSVNSTLNRGTDFTIKLPLRI